MKSKRYHKTKKTNNPKKPYKPSINSRMIFILSTFTLCLLVLLGRVGYMQFINADFYKQKVFSQHNKGISINANRGTIYDSGGEALAVSEKVHLITINPKFVRKNERIGERIKIDTIAEEVAKILDLNKEEVLTKFKRDSQYQIIASKVEKDVSDKLLKYIKNPLGRKVNNSNNNNANSESSYNKEDSKSANESIKGLIGFYFQDDTKRQYPNKNLAAHIIGFMRDDNVGLFGIEKIFDSELTGISGLVTSEIDGIGKEVPFNPVKKIEPQDGYNVHLTIDSDIQNIVDNALEKAIEDNEVANGAIGIVIEPSTGNILAMVSKPDYDLNFPRLKPNGVEKENWTGTSDSDIEILGKTAWKNRAVSDTYEPGSTFKSITTAAGLEEGVVSPNTPTSDRPIVVRSRRINCWSKRLHGDLPFYKGVYNSCNPVFVKVAQSLGVEKFYRYVRSFGFFEKTGITLHDESNSVFHEKPTDLDMAVASFGQRFEITPIQLSMAYGALINGGNLMEPRIVSKLTNTNGVTIKEYDPKIIRTSISKETSEKVREILQGVVTHGTGKNAYVIGYGVGGKTGTSETIVEGEYIASFSGFAPADDPRIHVLVVLDNPRGKVYYGGQIAAPVAGDIIEKTLEHMGVDKRYTKEDLKRMPKTVKIPDVRGKTIKEARKILKNSDLQCKIERENNDQDMIMEQMPKIGSYIERNSLIILYTYMLKKEVLVAVPNVISKSKKDAEKTLNMAGLNIRSRGIGKAVSQSKEVGERLPAGSIVEVEFKYLDTD